jgi:hypothetical protein
MKFSGHGLCAGISQRRDIMTTSNKDKGFKPGANMPHGDYDPAKEGMSESGNHAVGHPGNDNPGNHQQGQEANQGRADLHNKQSAAAAAADATRRDRSAGARGDKNSDTSRKSNS